MPLDFLQASKEVQANKMSTLKELGLKLLNHGPHKIEKASRRVRALLAGNYVFDTLEPHHVWEHPYFPQYYVPAAAVNNSSLSKKEYIDDQQSAFLATLNIEDKSTDRVLGFNKGPLAGLIRFEFAAMDAWFEEDQQIYGHPKDPYKRIDILPSSRRITVKIDGVTVAESTQNQFLYETSLRTRYYVPKTSANWKYFSPSETTTICPYKGTANYYNVTINGKEHKDIVWWYKYPTSESAPIAGHLCFYNEKLDIFVDGIQEDK